jgi:PKD repeat protein
LQDTASVLIGPVTTTLSLQSSPPGVQLALDTGGVTTPANHMVMAGSSHQLIAPEIESHRSFNSWTDGESAPVRSISVGTLPLTYTASYINRPPAATAGVAPGQAPFTAAFAVAQAADPEGDALSYHWDFGDGEVAESPSATHSFVAPGVYHVALSVADQLGLSSSYSFVLLIDRQGQVTSVSRFVRLPLVVR